MPTNLFHPPNAGNNKAFHELGADADGGRVAVLR
jgi:hypothetical protein